MDLMSAGQQPGSTIAGGTPHVTGKRDAQAQQLGCSDMQDGRSGPHVSRPSTGGYQVSDGTRQKGIQDGYSPGGRYYTSGRRSCVWLCIAG